jgi:predicted ATPase
VVLVRARVSGRGQGRLEDALAWNYDLLDEREKEVFRRCAVFPDAWTLEAMEAVCVAPSGDAAQRGSAEERGLRDAAAALVSAGLLQREDGADGETRFTMRAPVREYALKLLRESGEEHAVRQRRAVYDRAI